MESSYSLDPETGKRVKTQGDPTKKTAAFRELRDQYQNLIKESSSETGSYFIVDPDMDSMIQEAETYSDTRLSDMTLPQLQNIWNIVRSVESSISNENKLFSDTKARTVSDLAYALKESTDTKKSAINLSFPVGKAQDLLRMDMSDPYTYFHRMGEGGDEIYRILRKSQDKQTKIIEDIAERYQKAVKDVNVRNLEEEVKTFKIGNQKVKITTADIMELYLLMKREQGAKHILSGGIKIQGVKNGIIDTESAVPVKLTEADVAEITKSLTDKQMSVADEMQKLMDVLANYGNEASMNVYNYQKFTEKNYWPIRVSKDQTTSDPGAPSDVTGVPQYGFTKLTNPDANNAVIIGSAFDTFAQHVSQMSTYAAYLNSWEDVNRVHNYRFAPGDNVKQMVTRIMGKNGNAYWDRLLQDISQGTKAKPDTEFSMGAVTSAFKSAAVGANLRVILQQPTAGFRAAEIIPSKYLASGFARKGNFDAAKEYSPIAQWKDWGYFELGTGRSIKEILFQSESKVEKAKQLAMAPAGFMDSWTWGKLWNACEDWVSDTTDIRKGTTKFYNEVAGRFDEVIDRTQVVDTVLHRNQLMRSKNEVTKMASSFMSEPSKVYNMVSNALYDWRNASTKTGKAKAAKNVARMSAAVVVSFAANAVAQSLIDGLRDDDRKEEYWEKFLEKYKENFLANFNPLGYVPYLSDVSSIIEGYDVSRMDMEVVSDLVNASRLAAKSMGENGKYTSKYAFSDLAIEAAKLFGIPLSNLKRDVTSVLNTVANESGNHLMQYEIDKFVYNVSENKSRFADILYDAYKNDSDAYEIIYDDLIKSGFTKEYISSAMESRMKADQGVNSVLDLSDRYLPPDEKEKYDSLHLTLSKSSVWSEASKEQKSGIEEKAYQLVLGKSESFTEKAKDAEENGISQSEYLLYLLALDVADSNNENEEKRNGSYDQSETKEALEMLNGLSKKDKAYLWGATNKSWKTNPYS